MVHVNYHFEKPGHQICSSHRMNWTTVIAMLTLNRFPIRLALSPKHISYLVRCAHNWVTFPRSVVIFCSKHRYEWFGLFTTFWKMNSVLILKKKPSGKFSQYFVWDLDTIISLFCKFILQLNPESGHGTGVHGPDDIMLIQCLMSTAADFIKMPYAKLGDFITKTLIFRRDICILIPFNSHSAMRKR